MIPSSGVGGDNMEEGGGAYTESRHLGPKFHFSRISNVLKLKLSMRRVDQSKEEEVRFPGATPLMDRTWLMVGPEAAASAGASGFAHRCLLSWGRCWLRGRRCVWGLGRSKRGDSPLCRRGGGTSRKARGGGLCTGVGLVWASSGLGTAS